MSSPKFDISVIPQFIPEQSDTSSGIYTFAYFVTIKNVGDKQYLDHASNADYQHIEDYEGIVGMPEPGRDMRVGLAMRF